MAAESWEELPDRDGDGHGSPKNAVAAGSWEELLDRDGTGHGSPKSSVAADLADLADLAKHWEELLDRDGDALRPLSGFPNNTVVDVLFESCEDLLTLGSGFPDRVALSIDMMFLSFV